MRAYGSRYVKADGLRLGEAADAALWEALRLAKEVREDREARMRFAASERRLGKEIRALAKLAEINRRHGFG